MAESVKSVLIVGGGTAGWMAAAAIQRSTGPNVEVRLVESADIGIVGVGEATVPPIRDFNALIGLDEAEFMRETRATLKLGIEFRGWGTQDSAYFHPFGTFGPGPTLGDFPGSYFALKARDRAASLEAYSITSHAARRRRVGARSADPRSALAGFHTAYHFDATLYGQYLRRVCAGRGIERVEGEIVEVVQRPQDGFVDHVVLKDGRTLKSDLFIDCTGFRGLLIEGALKAGYEDWSHWLPMNRAMAVPCAKVRAADPFTLSTAEAAGWRWRIALQHRTGNGHVYCSDHMDDDTAREILLAGLDGEALAEPRPLRFVTGRRKKLWDRNVVALGLSSGFIEPLESTSIHLVQAGIIRLLQHWPDRDFSPVNTEGYNRRLGREIELIRDFVILHYHATTRDDSPFWQRVRAMSIPDSLAERVELFRDRGLLFQVGADEYFSQGSWLAVMMGQGIVPRAHNPLYDYQNLDQVAAGFDRIRQAWSATADNLPAHEDYLRQNGLWAGEAVTV
ncbi:tryptophan halogenase family protein [Brevundimonas sp. R86498]|uniref:tryptophan halogenase family protein n=1 Tax=Brevundimonas sp. R86498 TaxID=3093845 RepID=UPI0037CB9734